MYATQCKLVSRHHATFCESLPVKQLILDLLTSKKTLTAIVGAVITVIASSLKLPDETRNQIIALVMSYLVGQGLADSGKEAAKQMSTFPVAPPQILVDLLTSKKFLAMVVGIIMSIATKYGLNIPEDLVNQLVALIVTYVVGQGIADSGKEAARIKVQQ